MDDPARGKTIGDRTPLRDVVPHASGEPFRASSPFRRLTPAWWGVLAAILAVSLQAFFHVDDAPAYGLCMACHGQDLMQAIISDVGIGPDRRALPLLTTVGVVLGAVWAARRNHETARWSGGVHWRRVVLGMLAGFCSLVAMGCPTRLWLRIGYGDVTAIAPVISMVSAVVVTTMILRRWARRA